MTATRAEYGLLKPIIKKFCKEPKIDTRVVVTGMHLSTEFGMTVKEIEQDCINIDRKIEILLSSDTPVAISKSMGLAMISFAEYFDESRPDALMILGDRYETLAVSVAAMNACIPIFHLHGGETTEGAIDEAVRHAITKMSYLHFTSTEKYRSRVIQMGEAPDRVFSVGAMGVENALHIELMKKEELEESIHFRLGEKYAVGTFHPVTLEKHTAEEQVEALIKAIEKRPDLMWLFTKANADSNGRIINERLQEYSDTHTNLRLFNSLWMRRYLSSLKYAKFVIGNSSSGLIEAPSFKIPTINIGDRQKGRIQGETVLNCAPESDEIEHAIETVMTPKFQEKVKYAVNPYGNGNTSDLIINISKDFLINNKINIKKKFYDLTF